MNKPNLTDKIDFGNIERAFESLIYKPIWVVSDIAKNKLPINPHTGTKAKSNDPTTWGTLSLVQSFIEQNSGHFAPAIALHKEIELTCIDLDHVCQAEQIFDWAENIYRASSSYCERSISGNGLHVFIKGNKPGELCKKKTIEIYDDNKFITITGHTLPGYAEIKSAQTFLNSFYAETFTHESKQKPCFEKSPFLSDEEILIFCRNEKNNELFSKLFDHGDVTSFGNDHSAADLSLCAKLSFYTQDKEQILRLIRRSKLYREKWERKDYAERTIDKALSNVKATFQMPRQGKPSTWENPSKIDDGEDLEISFPLEELPLVLKEAVKEISRAFQVDSALVALPGLGMTALQIGKKALIKEKEGLFHHPALFLTGVAESGERKSSCYNVILDPIKDAIEAEIEEYKIQKAAVRSHNELIKEQVAHIKAELKAGKITKEAATDIIKELYASEKQQPPEPFNFGDDLTSPRLFQKLYEHNGAYGVFSSDARTIFTKILSKDDQNGNTGEAIYLGGMWGDDISRSRVGNNKGEIGGEDLVIRKPALTTVGFIQPDMWEEMAKNKRMRQSGMISRIGLVIAKSQMGTRIEKDTDVPLQLSRIIPFKDAVLRIRRWNANKVIVSLSEEAANRRREFYNTIEAELDAGGRYEDVKDIATKATSLAARLALIFSLLELAMKGDLALEIPPITEEQWLRAQALQEYFLAQAIDSQRSHSRTGKTHLLQKIARWLKKQVHEISKEKPITVLSSQIAKGNRGTSTSDIETNLIPKFIDMGWLRPIGNARGGKPRYEINSKI